MIQIDQCIMDIVLSYKMIFNVSFRVFLPMHMLLLIIIIIGICISFCSLFRLYCPFAGASNAALAFSIYYWFILYNNHMYVYYIVVVTVCLFVPELPLTAKYWQHLKRSDRYTNFIYQDVIVISILLVLCNDTRICNMCNVYIYFV